MSIIKDTGAWPVVCRCAVQTYSEIAGGQLIYERAETKQAELLRWEAI